MKSLVLGFLLLAAPVCAQTPPIDDCPAGATLHRSLTALDHDSMLAAYTASFVGLFHRQPSMQPGSGSDDGEYWIAISNHYGEYGDSVCRAGWNLYRERQIGGIPTGPKDGDVPASFLPNAPVPVPTPVPTPTPVPAPLPNPPNPPLPSVDLTPILNTLAVIEQNVIAIRATEEDTNKQVTEMNKGFSDYVVPFFKFVAKYIVPAATAWLAAKHL